MFEFILGFFIGRESCKKELTPSQVKRNQFFAKIVLTIVSIPGIAWVIEAWNEQLVEAAKKAASQDQITYDKLLVTTASMAQASLVIFVIFAAGYLVWQKVILPYVKNDSESK